jgi:glycine oxidase
MSADAAETAAPTGVDVAVIGGGVIGLATAWRVATAGASVAVIDERPGRAAAWAAAGMLAPATEAHYGEEGLLRLNLASRDRWPDFARELEDASGRSPGYRETGTLVVARDRDDKAALDELLTFQRGLGLPVEPLTSRACRRLEPALAPTARAGLLVGGDHQVDNRELMRALAVAVERAGVVTVAGRATAVTRDGDRATGVELADGRHLEAGTVVLAAGAWSAGLGGLPPRAVPVRPVKGQLLHLRHHPRSRSEPPLLGRNLRAAAGRRPGGPAVYLVPRGDGRIILGATVEERGQDVTVTAGAALDLLRHAYELVPDVAECELLEIVAGLRPGTPDNAPLLGPVGLDRLLVATGHFRNGILLTPITAEIVAAAVTTGRLPDLAAPFSPQRFLERDGVAVG